MPGIRIASLAVLVAAGGCSVGASTPPAYPQQPPQTAWYGPPGGNADPGYSYELPAVADGSYEGSYPPDGDDPSAMPEPSADPSDPGYVMGDVTDVEIDATLDANGEWIEDEDYGRVWLPYTTVVGADFTPYDSSGDWIYTDYGWSFASDFDWGWLAFHFGRWALFGDDRWGWVPDHTWGPAWCEWRNGGNAVGWRPTPPTLRDHRTAGNDGTWHPSTPGGANIRDHRTHKDPDSTWHFAATNELGLRHRPTSFAMSDGLRTTTPVVRPPSGTVSGRAASLMTGRMHGAAWTQTHPMSVRPRGDTRPAVTGGRAQRPWTGSAGGELGLSTGGGRTWIKPPSPWGSPSRQTVGGSNPRAAQRMWPRSEQNDNAWRRPDPNTNAGTWNNGSVQPNNGGSVQNNGGAYQQPRSWNNGGSYNPPPRNGGAYNPPPRSWGNGGSYQPPSRNPGSYNPPPRSWGNGGSYQPPSRSGGSYNPPPRSWSNGGTAQPPPRSWSNGGSYSPPSRPSSSWGSGGSRPSGSWGSGSSGSSRSSGSYSSGGSSRSSGSSSSGSSRSSGSSSSGSSRSSGSSGGGGGGRHR